MLHRFAQRTAAGALLFLVLMTGAALAQPTYTATDLGPQVFTSIVGTPGATMLGTVTGCDDCTETVTLPFTFDFYGRAITSVAVSSNGQINMDGSTSSWCCSPHPIPAADGNDDRIFFAKSDLCPGCDATSEAWHTTQGSPGSQIWIMEFYRSAFCCGSIPPEVTVQVWLYEADSSIEIYWGTGDISGETISAGVEDIGGLDGTPAISGAFFDPVGMASSTYPTNTGCRFDRGDALQLNSLTFAPGAPAPGGLADVMVEVENNDPTPYANVRVDLFIDPPTPPGPFDQSPTNTTVSLGAGPATTGVAIFPGLTSPVTDIWRLYANVNSDSAVSSDQRTNNLLGPVLMGWSQAFVAICGDCNNDGVVTILDALRSAQLAAGLLFPLAEDYPRCDVDSTITFTVLDALLMAQFAAGLPVTMSCPPPPGAPAVEVLDPVAGSDVGFTRDIVMDLWEPGGLPIDVNIEYSTDAGATFAACTADPGSPLPNPAMGVPAPAMDVVFTWDALADIPLLARPTTGLLRVTVNAGMYAHSATVDPLNFILLPDFGEEVLLVTGTVDSLDLTIPRWSSTGFTLVQMDPGTIDATYASGAALQAQFWCIWAGCQGTITNAPFPTMMGPGGKIEEFVNLGGIFVAHGAHNNPVEVLGPGGMNFRSYQVSSTTDENPQVQDLDHEFITGAGYGGVALTSATFQGWGTSCHGVMDPGPFGDAAGVNLGLNPMPGFYNNILQSPANGGVPAIMEVCHGQGYCMVDGMTFDWSSRGTTPQDALLQSVQYIVFIRPTYNQ